MVLTKLFVELECGRPCEKVGCHGLEGGSEASDLPFPIESLSGRLPVTVLVSPSPLP